MGFKGPLAKVAMDSLTAVFTPECSLDQSFSPFFPSLNPQVQESDADEQDFGGYTLAFAEGELKSKLKNLSDRLVVGCDLTCF